MLRGFVQRESARDPSLQGRGLWGRILSDSALLQHRARFASTMCDE